jgi:hypothetical protein
MVTHYIIRSDSTHTECGRDVHKVRNTIVGNRAELGGDANGVDCYYCLNSLSKRGIKFSPPAPIMHAKDCTCIICITIGARDKWWVKRIEEMFNGYVNPTCLECSRGDSCYVDASRCPLWQSLKNEVTL